MVGRLTIEQAFTHLGPPARCGDAGQVRTCLWVRGSATNVAVPLGGYWVNQTIPPRTMTLTFLNGVLSNYRLTGDWE
jgi:hypothetical protein